jgi:hypothetical protein
VTTRLSANSPLLRALVVGWVPEDPPPTWSVHLELVALNAAPAADPATPDWALAMV